MDPEKLEIGEGDGGEGVSVDAAGIESGGEWVEKGMRARGMAVVDVFRALPSDGPGDSGGSGGTFGGHPVFIEDLDIDED